MDIDKELSDHIKDTLAGYEEEYVAGAWENFAHKQKYLLKKEEDRRQRVIYMRFAAALAACLILGIFLLNKYENKQPAGTTIPRISVINDSNKTDSGQMLASPNNDRRLAPETLVSYVAKVQKVINENEAQTKTDTQPADITQTVAQTYIQQATNQKAIAPGTTTDTSTNKPDNTISQNSTQTITEKNTARRVRFGLNVAQGINSTKSSTAFNYSGGVNIDIPLSKSLAITTGIQVENQTVESKSTVSNTAIPSDNTRASLINLDIPLNIKWKFLTRRSGSFYIAGGISSLAYLSEKYTTTSRKQELREAVSFMGNEETRTYKLENVETTTTNTAGASNQFDIAGRLNISIGFEKQISPSLYLHIEPFMKIPVSGLATENLIFTTSGITFKISF